MIVIPISPAEYLAWEEQQELRYEYVDGRVYPRNATLGMPGGTLPHTDIALNLYSVLRTPMCTRGCRVNVADVRVQIGEDGAFFYPDVRVAGHPQDKAALKCVRYLLKAGERTRTVDIQLGKLPHFLDIQGF